MANKRGANCPPFCNANLNFVLQNRTRQFDIALAFSNLFISHIVQYVYHLKKTYVRLK